MAKKEYNITERRTANYAGLGVTGTMEACIVYKVAERCIMPIDAFQSTLSSTKKMEYRIGLVTHALNDYSLLDCFDFLEGAETFLRSLHEKTDRLVILRCMGYTDSSWEVPPENKAKGWLSIKVKAIEPNYVVKTYEECMKGGKQNGS